MRSVHVLAGLVFAASGVFVACSDNSVTDVVSPKPLLVPIKASYDCVFAEFSNGSTVYSCTTETYNLATVYVYGASPEDGWGDPPHPSCYETNSCWNWGTCASAGGCGTGTTDPTPPAEAPEDDYLAPPAIPDCTRTDLLLMAKAWCEGRVPNPDESTKIRASLNRMVAKGGVCRDLGNIGLHYINDGKLRMVDGIFWKMGGAAPRNGGIDSYLVIATQFTERFWDAAHKTVVDSTELMSRDLDQVLAHELDHLNGADHLTSNPPKPSDRFATPNSNQCSDITY